MGSRKLRARVVVDEVKPKRATKRKAAAKRKPAKKKAVRKRG